MSKPAYCVQNVIESCVECCFSNYGFDCRNKPILSTTRALKAVRPDGAETVLCVPYDNDEFHELYGMTMSDAEMEFCLEELGTIEVTLKLEAL